MPGCVLRYCKNTSKNTDKSSGVTFHRFPRGVNNPREEWLAFVRNDRSEPNWSPNEHTYLCSDHFKETDFVFTKTGRKFTNLAAVPVYPSKYSDVHPESSVEPAKSQDSANVDIDKVDEGSWDSRKVTVEAANSRGILGSPRVNSGYGAILEAATTIRQPTTVCCVFGCRNSVRDNPDKEFFPFPGDPELCSRWLKLINREDLARKLKAGQSEHRVCSDHFDDNDCTLFTVNHGVVPHKNLPVRKVSFVYANPDPSASGSIRADIKKEAPESMEVQFGLEEKPGISFKPNMPPQLKPVDQPYIPPQHKPVYRPHIPVQQVVVNPPHIPVQQVIVNPPHIPVQHVVVNPPHVPIQQKPVNHTYIPLQHETVYEPEKPMDVDIPLIQVANSYSLVANGADSNMKGKDTEIQTGLSKKEKFLRRATISGVEHVYLPGTFLCGDDTNVVYHSASHTQTTKALLDHLNAPFKKKYETELKETNKRIREWERKMAAFSRTQMGKKEFQNGCDTCLDPKFSRLVKCHINLASKPCGNRYSNDFKTLALNLFYSSAQSYKFVEKLFLLPSKATMKRTQAPIRTGINANLIESFKIKVDEMSAKEKMCTVCFDYMGLNKNLNYCVYNDFLYGLQDIDQVAGNEPAEYATLIMVRGLFSKWKQPISFAYLSEKRCYPELKEWLHKIIAMLLDIGLNVKALVTNLETEFVDFSDISVEEPYFEVCGRRIYQIIDVPLLFKSARDDFMKYNFQFDSKVAKWSHIVKVYSADRKQTLRLIPKITDSHVRPNKESKNDVKLAIQIFSRTVAAAINFHVTANLINKNAKDTVEFIQTMNNLFDILNSQKLAHENEFKRAYTGTEGQKEFLVNTLEYFEKLVIRDKRGDVVDERPRFVTGLLITIKSVVALLDELKQENCNYLLTKHLSKDCMKTYFDKVRKLSGHCCNKPTPIMFARSFRRLFLVNLVSNTKEGGSQMNLKSTLTKISDYVKVDDDSNKEETEQPKNLKIAVGDYQKFWPTPSAAFTSGYLLWKCLERHACDKLIEHLSIEYKLEAPNADFLIDKFKEYNAKNLLKTDLLPPPKFFVEIVEKMDRIFDGYLKRDDKEMNNFGWNIYMTMVDEQFESPCNCFPFMFLKFLFIRMKIFHTVRHYNRSVKPAKKAVIMQNWKKRNS